MKPSFTGMGFVTGILALLAYLFRDNPVMQGLLSLIGMDHKDKEVTQERPAGASAGGAAGGKQQPEGHAPADAPKANAPSEAAVKLEFDIFAHKAKKQITETMNATIDDVEYNPNLSQKDKAKILDDLRMEKKNQLKQLERELSEMTPEKQQQLALAPDAQAAILKAQQDALMAGRAQLMQMVGQTSAEHMTRNSFFGKVGDGSAEVCKYTGYGALAAFAGAGACWVAGGLMTATGVGAAVGVPLMAAGTTLGLSAGGYMLAASTTTGLVAGASHIANGETMKGVVEAAFSAPGIRQIGMTARIGKTVASKAVEESTELALKGGAVEGRTMLGRAWNQVWAKSTGGRTDTQITQFGPATDAIRTSVNGAFNNGASGFGAATKEGLEEFAQKTGKEAADVASSALKNDARIIGEQVTRSAAHAYVRKNIINGGAMAIGDIGAAESGPMAGAASDFLTPASTPVVKKNDAIPSKQL